MCFVVMTHRNVSFVHVPALALKTVGQLDVQSCENTTNEVKLIFYF